MAGGHNAIGEVVGIRAQLKFCTPRMLMSLFIMSYLVCDGICVSYFLGTDALSALNMSYPVMAVAMAFGTMVSAGGASVAARRLGARADEAAARAFMGAVLLSLGFGAVIGAAVGFETDAVLGFLKVTPELKPVCADYLDVVLPALPLFLFGFTAAAFFTVTGRPMMGLWLSIASGLSNIAFDVLFMGSMEMGMTGAALATVLSWCVTAAGAVWYFTCKSPSLRFKRVLPDFAGIIDMIQSGAAEMVGNLSSAVTVGLFNAAFMLWLGTDGVAALAVCTYTLYVFNAVYYGLSEGSAPLIAFRYGAGVAGNLRAVCRSTFTLAAAISLASFVLSVVSHTFVLRLFAAPGSHVYELVSANFVLFACALLFAGLNTAFMMFFTAVGDGKRAGLLSLLKTLIFMVAAIEGLPHLIGEAGLWVAVPTVEVATFVVGLTMIVRAAKRITESMKKTMKEEGV